MHEGGGAPDHVFLQLPPPSHPPPTRAHALSLMQRKGNNLMSQLEAPGITSRTFPLLWDSWVPNSRVFQTAPSWDAGAGGSCDSCPPGGPEWGSDESWPWESPAPTLAPGPSAAAHSVRPAQLLTRASPHQARLSPHTSGDVRWSPRPTGGVTGEPCQGEPSGTEGTQSW